MATSLQRLGSHSRNAYGSVLPQMIRRFSSDSLLVEYKAGEIGSVSGIPEEHLQRRASNGNQFDAPLWLEEDTLVTGAYVISNFLFTFLLRHVGHNVLIYSPARTASQQGSGKVGKWKINFMSTQKWENPLMGWTSTGDPYSNVGDSALSFDSEADARAFAERHGWNYTVKKHHAPLLKVKTYADNFKWKGPPKTPEN